MPLHSSYETRAEKLALHLEVNYGLQLDAVRHRILVGEIEQFLEPETKAVALRPEFKISGKATVGGMEEDPQLGWRLLIKDDNGDRWTPYMPEVDAEALFNLIKENSDAA